MELGDLYGPRLDRKWVKEDIVSLTRTPSELIVVVAGGPGRHTTGVHGFGTSCESVTEGLNFF